MDNVVGELHSVSESCMVWLKCVLTVHSPLHWICTSFTWGFSFRSIQYFWFSGKMMLPEFPHRSKAFRMLSTSLCLSPSAVTVHWGRPWPMATSTPPPLTDTPKARPTSHTTRIFMVKDRAECFIPSRKLLAILNTSFMC